MKKLTWLLVLSMLPLVTIAPAMAEDRVTIEYFFQSTEMASEDVDIMKPALEEALDVDLLWNAVPTDYQTQLNVRLAGGTPPDIFQVERYNIPSYIKQDLLLDLTPYLDQMPHVKAEFTEQDLERGYYEGKMYTFARRPYLTYASLHLRMDWLENLGLEAPKTLEDFAAVMHAFTYDDPDGNGKDDTYGWTGLGNELSAFTPFYGAYGTAIPGRFLIRDGELIYSTIDPRAKEAILYIKSLVDDGIMDPEIIANAGEIHIQKAFRGEVGGCYQNFWLFEKPQYAAQIAELSPDADWKLVDAPEGPYGDAFSSTYDPMQSPGLVAVHKDVELEPEKLEKVLQLFDYLADPEGGGRLTMFGLEGEHYELDADGNVVALPKMDELVYSFNYQLAGRDDLPYCLVKFPFMKDSLDFTVNMPTLDVYNSSVTIPETVTYSDIKRYSEEETVKFIYGERPIEEWDAFVETLLTTYNLQAYIDSAEVELREAGLL